MVELMKYAIQHLSYTSHDLSPLLLLITGCGKPNPHPKHPNYKITKPKVTKTPNKKNLSKMVKKLQGSPYVWAEEGTKQF